ncbi:MAG: hypothetical protein AABX51_08715 [Nanoarchaeota archaeon]
MKHNITEIGDLVVEKVRQGIDLVFGEDSDKPSVRREDREFGLTGYTHVVLSFDGPYSGKAQPVGTRIWTNFISDNGGWRYELVEMRPEKVVAIGTNDDFDAPLYNLGVGLAQRALASRAEAHHAYGTSMMAE